MSIKKQFRHLILASLVFGTVGMVVSAYIQHHYYWSDTMYGIEHCTTQSPGLPTVTDSSAPNIPSLSGCTGVRVGWPTTFVASDIQVSVGVNNPKLPLTTSELFAFSDLHLHIVNFLLDWLFWSTVGFGMLSLSLVGRDNRKNV